MYSSAQERQPTLGEALAALALNELRPRVDSEAGATGGGAQKGGRAKGASLILAS